ncbi:hypothetical protein D7X98_05785 [bacterium 1XD8-76]|nr:hypothetical protein D7X98_05785 [bacterium 1XD8-76]
MTKREFKEVNMRGQGRCILELGKKLCVILALTYACLCLSMRLSVRETSYAEGECMLYYIVNADGMKGLGHSILMVVDGEGRGTVLSFNGMQRSLSESLMGKSGIGKLSVGVMDAEETKAFLGSGDLSLEGDQLADNYDMALYRPITREDYRIVLEQVLPYREAEEGFTVLYGKWVTEEDAAEKAEYRRALEQMAEDESLPLYQIYTNNCDHAARMMASPVDQDLFDYTYGAWRMTPNGNLKAFGKKAEKWGVMELGEQTLAERILMFLVSF